MITTPEDAVGRRHLFHGAAVLAAVAAGGGVLAAAAPAPARAADGDAVFLGRTNQSTSTTTVEIAEGGSGSASPVLALQNAAGPLLQLQPLDESWDDPLEVGQLANRTNGPIIGVDHGAGSLNTYFALGTDLQALPTPYAVDPVRLADTRISSGRDNILTPGDAFSTSYRLRAGHWFDLAVMAADDAFSIEGIWANITLTEAVTGGYLAVYPPGPRPVISAVNYPKAQATSNAGFFRPGVVQDYYAIRLYSSAEAHVIVDLTGLNLVQQPGPRADKNARQSMSRSRRHNITPADLTRKLGR